MSESAYKPKLGTKVELGINAMRQGPMSLVQLGQVMSVQPSSVPAMLLSALRKDFVIKGTHNSGVVHYALAEMGFGDGFSVSAPVATNAGGESDRPKTQKSQAEPEDEPESQFGCALWSDGDLQLARDGEAIAILSPHEVEIMRRYFQLMPVIS